MAAVLARLAEGPVSSGFVVSSDSFCSEGEWEWEKEAALV